MKWRCTLAQTRVSLRAVGREICFFICQDVNLLSTADHAASYIWLLLTSPTGRRGIGCPSSHHHRKVESAASYCIFLLLSSCVLAPNHLPIIRSQFGILMESR